MRRHRSKMWKAAPAAWVVLMVGASVAYAAVHQTALTGRAEVRSKPLGTTIDVQMAQPADGNCATATYVAGDLSTALFMVTDATQGQVNETSTICLRNTGARQAYALVSVYGVENTDPQCTGDEALVDSTCGSPAEIGELAGQLRVGARECDTPTSLNNPAPPGSWTNIARYVSPGATNCFRIVTSWPSQSWSDEVAAQSDVAAWRFLVTTDPV